MKQKVLFIISKLFRFNLLWNYVSFYSLHYAWNNFLGHFHTATAILSRMMWQTLRSNWNSFSSCFNPASHIVLQRKPRWLCLKYYSWFWTNIMCKIVIFIFTVLVLYLSDTIWLFPARFAFDDKTILIFSLQYLFLIVWSQNVKKYNLYHEFSFNCSS